MNSFNKKICTAALGIVMLSTAPLLSYADSGPMNNERPKTHRERLDLAKQYSTTAAFADQVIFMDELPQAGTINFLTRLQGRVPGLYIQGWGMNPYVSIRGSRRPPLMVVDGLPMHISAANMLNPEDIALVEIHKGVNSAAFWGGRASGGVIVVNTKR